MGAAINLAPYTIDDRLDTLGPSQLCELDSNQRARAERAVDRLSFTNPEDDAGQLVEAAIAEGLRMPTAREAANGIAELRNGPAYCYLAFHGIDGVAQFVKVGMTRHPEQRMYNMATGNPLDCLWVYVCQLQTASAAYGVEQKLLRHMASHKRRGEWLSIGAADEAMAASIAQGLADVAGAPFTLLGYTDGR